MDRFRKRTILVLLFLTIAAILVQGYHPGAEDDAVYLSAIKMDLHPALYPHDSDLFRIQLQATIFDRLVSAYVRLTHLPLLWAILLLHFSSIYLLLWGCWRISRRCFIEDYARWAGVTMVAALLTLPVAGTALYLTDQSLHPRALATALILHAIVAVLDGRRLLSGALLLVALTLHPIMAAFGVSYCLFLAVGRRRTSPRPQSSTVLVSAGMALPSRVPSWFPSWIFEPPSAPWRAAVDTRTYYHIFQWRWYEWLGVFAPLLILWYFWRVGRREGSPVLARLSSRLVSFSIFQLVVAIAMLYPARFERLLPMQPMRYLQLVYLLMALLGGGLLGQKLLRKRVWAWLLLFVPLASGMFYAQRMTYPGSPHLELPGVTSANPWLKSFAWIREYVPNDAYFAIDSDYMRAPGEDNHSFRALAERSVLADAVKDAAVATQVPRLGEKWLQQSNAQQGLDHFGKNDLKALRERFGVNWVVLQRPHVVDMDCPYQNERVAVCRID